MTQWLLNPEQSQPCTVGVEENLKDQEPVNSKPQVKGESQGVSLSEIFIFLSKAIVSPFFSQKLGKNSSKNTFPFSWQTFFLLYYFLSA